MEFIIDILNVLVHEILVRGQRDHNGGVDDGEGKTDAGTSGGGVQAGICLVEGDGEGGEKERADIVGDDAEGNVGDDVHMESGDAVDEGGVSYSAEDEETFENAKRQGGGKEENGLQTTAQRRRSGRLHNPTVVEPTSQLPALPTSRQAAVQELAGSALRKKKKRKAPARTAAGEDTEEEAEDTDTTDTRKAGPSWKNYRQRK